MRKALTMLGAIAALAFGSLFVATPASAQTHGGVTCAQYTHPSGIWPADGSHFKVCFNNWTMTRLFQVIYATGGPGASGNFIKNQGTVYYYFKNRADMNTWMTGEFGTSSHTNTTAVCGHTGYTFGIGYQHITPSIFDECIIQGATVPNPDLRKVVNHESGHAFEYALAAAKLLNRGQTPAMSSGYRQLVLDDKNGLSNFAMCTLFQGTPSAYEVTLGLGASPGAVCTGSTINPGYTNQLATANAKAPYFVNQSGTLRFGELFAEQFSILAGGVGGASNSFRLTDNIVKDGVFECTFTVVQSYIHTLQPPGPSNPNAGFQSLPSQCSAVSENDLK